MAKSSAAMNGTLRQYGLLDAPFSISPDPRFLYLSRQHHLALSKIRYVIDNRQGLAVLYGDVGHGKSTLLRRIYTTCHTDIFVPGGSFSLR